MPILSTENYHRLNLAGFGWQCDNYNLKSHRWCNNMSCMSLSGYVGRE